MPPYFLSPATQTPMDYVRETGVLMWRMLSPWTVSKQEYSLMRCGTIPGRGVQGSPRSRAPGSAPGLAPPAPEWRRTLLPQQTPCPRPPPLPSPGSASFYLTHSSLGPEPVLELFHPYLVECTERDGARVVGLGLMNWVFIIAFVLLSSERGGSGRARAPRAHTCRARAPNVLVRRYCLLRTSLQLRPPLERLLAPPRCSPASPKAPSAGWHGGLLSSRAPRCWPSTST